MYLLSALYPYIFPAIVAIVAVSSCNIISRGFFNARNIVLNYFSSLVIVFLQYYLIPLFNFAMFEDNVQYIGVYGLIERFIFISIFFIVIYLVFFKKIFSGSPNTCKVVFIVINIILMTFFLEVILLRH